MSNVHSSSVCSVIPFGTLLLHTCMLNQTFPKQYIKVKTWSNNLTLPYNSIWVSINTKNHYELRLIYLKTYYLQTWGANCSFQHLSSEINESVHVDILNSQSYQHSSTLSTSDIICSSNSGVSLSFCEGGQWGFSTGHF